MYMRDMKIRMRQSWGVGRGHMVVVRWGGRVAYGTVSQGGRAMVKAIVFGLS